MRHDRLSDAAIALHRARAAENVKHGIFGGYAVSVLGGPRESKDIDCIAALNKEQVVAILSRQGQFKPIPQNRVDYVAFFWSDDPKSNRDHVLIEIFTEKYPGESFFSACSIQVKANLAACYQGAQFSLQNLAVQTFLVTGSKMGEDNIFILDPFTIFKGRLLASATRVKFSDTVDLRWLAGKFPDIFQQKANQLNLENIG